MLERGFELGQAGERKGVDIGRRGEQHLWLTSSAASQK